jgi:hypothetical protein
VHTPAASAAGDEAILAAPRPDAASRPPSRTTTCAVSARRKHAHAAARVRPRTAAADSKRAPLFLPAGSLACTAGSRPQGAEASRPLGPPNRHSTA